MRRCTGMEQLRVLRKEEVMSVVKGLIIEGKNLKQGELPVNKIVHGNTLDVLKKLPDESVDCVITSPPYWSKRDYGGEANTIWGGDPNCDHEWGEEIIVRGRGVAGVGNTGNHSKIIPGQGTHQIYGKFCKKCGAWKGQLGLEPTPQMFVDHLIEIFREVKRVLKPTGNVFVNLDDTYAGSGKGFGSFDPKWPKAKDGKLNLRMFHSEAPRKSLCLVPELFAIRMVYDLGFILRNKIIWAKKVHIYKDRETIGNAMPESVRDRLTHTWEYIYHFTKKPKYHYNLDAVRVPLKTSTPERAKTVKLTGNSKYVQMDVKTASPGGRLQRLIAEGKDKEVTLVRKAITNVNAYLKQKLKESGLTVAALSKMIGVKETTLAHYFRTDLSGSALPPREVWEAMKPILGLDDYEQHIKEEYKSVIPSPNPLGANPGDVVQINLEPLKEAHYAPYPTKLVEFLIKAGCPVDGVVLDPFLGSGTTALVALKMGRRFVGIEIVKEYCEIAQKRVKPYLGQTRLYDFVRGV